MEIFNSCGEDYKRATCGKQWKTAGDDVQYCLEVQEDTLFVHYQCSSSKRDWVNNFNVFPKRVKLYTDMEGKKYYVWVHRGLWNAFYSAWCMVAQEIADIEKLTTINHYVFDGHSFGGAMSIFSSIVWWHRVSNVKALRGVSETWGAPKVIFGKSRNVDLLGEGLVQNKHINYQCYNDFITKLPPFYRKNMNVVKVGEKFNLFKMLRNADYYHTCYGEFTDVTRRFEKRY